MLRLLPLAVLLIVGCSPEPVPPRSDGVEVLLWTPSCEPDFEPETHFHVPAGAYTISWDALCVRDAASIAWWAVKISYWEDRADDAWNVWLIDPSIQEVHYAEGEIDAAIDPNVLNPDHPFALERVAPAPLEYRDYRVEVWGVVDNYLDSQRNEVRLTLVDE